MFYAIMGVLPDHADALEARLKARPAHLKRLEQLQEEGRLLLAGPNPAIDSEEPGPAGFTGSLIIAEFSDLETARTWAEQDPYTLAGVFSEITVKPFLKVFPK